MRNNGNNIKRANFNNKIMTPREVSRLLAIMVVNVIQYDGQNKTEALDYLIKEDYWKEDLKLNENIIIPKPKNEFLIEIVNAVVDNKLVIDDIIKKNIENPRIIFEELDKLIIAILECGTTELLKKNVEKQVLLSQYSFLASCFFDLREISITNAILNSIAESIESFKE